VYGAYFGTAFELKPKGAKWGTSLLCSFKGSPDARIPAATLIFRQVRQSLWHIAGWGRRRVMSVRLRHGVSGSSRCFNDDSLADVVDARGVTRVNVPINFVWIRESAVGPRFRKGYLRTCESYS